MLGMLLLALFWEPNQSCTCSLAYFCVLWVVLLEDFFSAASLQMARPDPLAQAFGAHVGCLSISTADFPQFI